MYYTLQDFKVLVDALLEESPNDRDALFAIDDKRAFGGETHGYSVDRTGGLVRITLL